MSEFDKRTSAPPLTQLTLSLTDGCGLSCRSCGTPFFHMQTKQAAAGERFLPLDTALQAVHEALPLGLRHVQMAGGQKDVLLHPHFEQMLDQLERMELPVTIETNGAGLSETRAQRMARMPQCNVAIQLDGADAATHDRLHNTPGAFDTAVHAARILSKHGLAPQMVFTILRQNAGQIPNMLHLAKASGARTLRLVIPRPPELPLAHPFVPAGVSPRPRPALTGSGQKPTPTTATVTAQATLEVAELIALGRKIERELLHTTRVKLLFDQPPAFRGLSSSSRMEGYDRRSILNSLSVLSTGEFALCNITAFLDRARMNGHASQLYLGQVGKVSLEQLWHKHPALEMLREGLPDRLEGVCARCVFKASCQGYCAVENYLTTGSFWGPHWFCDTAEQSGLFPAGRLLENTW